MSKLSIKLKNCYGIEKLDNTEFDFTNTKTFCIYASNASMKTSLTKTFSQIQNNEEPKEEIYNKKAEWTIQVDGKDIKPDEIFTIKSKSDGYESSPDTISKLLVDEKNKYNYDRILSDILKSKNKLLGGINKLSKISKNDIENKILEDFSESKTNFLDFISTYSELEDKNNLKEIEYSTIFNNDVLSLLSDEEVVKNIDEYFKKYNELIKDSEFFVDNVFGPYNAEVVSSTLDKENYFLAEHKLKLKNGDELSGEDLVKRIEAEKKYILSNNTLKQIESKITKKASVRDFQKLISEKPELLLELKDLDAFKKKLWSAYLKDNQSVLDDLIKIYSDNKTELNKIEEQADIQKTDWQKVIEDFDKRFIVPFKIRIKNEKSSVLGREVPNIVFDFGKGSVPMNRKELESKNTLSQGEQKALYILNILFDIQSRKGQKTFFIIDDIADSFDYKNKYAIVQYLKEINENNDNFFQIILTHNFDFFRTIQRRLSCRKFCLLSNRQNGKILLSSVSEHNILDPFTHYKNQCKNDIDAKNIKFFMALIPFTRNLIEYKNKDEDSKKLSNFLHFYAEELSYDDALKIQKNTINISKDTTIKISSMRNKLFELADSIDGSEFDLSNNIILSIATRVKAEMLMRGKITDDDEKNKKQEIGKLFDYCKTENLLDDIELKLMDRVVVMTPETIHINSFMYEPILDMGTDEIKSLYAEVSKKV